MAIHVGVAAAPCEKLTIRTRRKAPLRQFSLEKPPNPTFWAVCLKRNQLLTEVLSA